MILYLIAIDTIIHHNLSNPLKNVIEHRSNNLNKLRFEFDEIYVSSKFIMPLKFIFHRFSRGMQSAHLEKFLISSIL